MKKPPVHDQRSSPSAFSARPKRVVVDRETVELKRLEKRMGRVHLQQRIGIESEGLSLA